MFNWRERAQKALIPSNMNTLALLSVGVCIFPEKLE